MTHLHFCEKGVKTGASVYKENVLLGVVKPLNTTLFNGQEWVFQQDSAPAHKAKTTAKTTQEWLWRHVPAFISAENWPSGSPNLNPLDYNLWAVFEDMACRKSHNSLDSLKRSLLKAAAEIPLETVRAAIAEWPERLKACVGAEGGHFE
jgi:inhibitor of nuclear factor kappa-B kinase subunit alpha